MRWLCSEQPAVFHTTVAKITLLGSGPGSVLKRRHRCPSVAEFTAESERCDPCYGDWAMLLRDSLKHSKVSQLSHSWV